MAIKTFVFVFACVVALVAAVDLVRVNSRTSTSAKVTFQPFTYLDQFLDRVSYQDIKVVTNSKSVLYKNRAVSAGTSLLARCGAGSLNVTATADSFLTLSYGASYIPKIDLGGVVDAIEFDVNAVSFTAPDTVILLGLRLDLLNLLKVTASLQLTDVGTISIPIDSFPEALVSQIANLTVAIDIQGGGSTSVTLGKVKLVDLPSLNYTVEVAPQGGAFRLVGEYLFANIGTGVLISDLAPDTVYIVRVRVKGETFGSGSAVFRTLM